MPRKSILRYSVGPGRAILASGIHIVSIARYVKPDGSSDISPTDCDRLAHHIARLLNQHPLPARTKGGK